VIFDINGTIQFNGQISEEVREKFDELKNIYDLYLISADTRGNLKELAEALDIAYIKIVPFMSKITFLIIIFPWFGILISFMI
jgi:soluble P-type ATPase